MTVLIELILRLCGSTVFEPMPTIWHVIAVSAVPLINFSLWWHLRSKQPTPLIQSHAHWFMFAGGAAIAIASIYSLIFLPLVPLAVIAILYFGLGLLPLAPITALIYGIVLSWKLSSRVEKAQKGRYFSGGLAAALGALALLDVPPAATHIGVQWAVSNDATQRERGISLIRNLGDKNQLLRLCYDTVPQPMGIVSTIVAINSIFLRVRQPHEVMAMATPAQAREIYYRVTGTPFNAKPAPFRTGPWAVLNDFDFDSDLGGAEVGGRVKGLSLVSSRMDASISGDDAVAYLEWTLEFRNVAQVDREARLTMALPPGGVVSRASLWVNGEEREAAYGGRGEVRAAYQKVAVQQRRDPLLVTTKGADRILAQAFPVPRAGGTIKFKVGITAPLELSDPAKGRLVLPAIFDRNFSFPTDKAHNIWLESKQPLATATPGLTSTTIGSGAYRLSGSLRDSDASRIRPVIQVTRNAAAGPVAVKIGDGQTVVQEVMSTRPTTPASLMLVVDGSSKLQPFVGQLIEAVRAVPADAEIGLVLAGEPLQRTALAPATDAHKQSIIELLRSTAFVGGQDNAPALAQAVLALEGRPHGKLLWVHGPQPLQFLNSRAVLQQVADRIKRLPPMTLYSVEPGPNEVLPDSAMGWTAHLLPRTAALDVDLSAYLSRELGAGPTVSMHRKVATDAIADGKGSEHIGRLWVRDRVVQLATEGRTESLKSAIELAAQHRLVTPVSGAVVLETQQQYVESGLTPVSQATVPTVPEPHEWALLALMCMGLGWLLWRQRQQGRMAI
jgi:hypothetical protein